MHSFSKQWRFARTWWARLHGQPLALPEEPWATCALRPFGTRRRFIAALEGSRNYFGRGSSRMSAGDTPSAFATLASIFKVTFWPYSMRW